MGSYANHGTNIDTTTTTTNTDICNNINIGSDTNVGTQYAIYSVDTQFGSDTGNGQ